MIVLTGLIKVIKRLGEQEKTLEVQKLIVKFWVWILQKFRGNFGECWVFILKDWLEGKGVWESFELNPFHLNDQNLVTPKQSNFKTNLKPQFFPHLLNILENPLQFHISSLTTSLENYLTYIYPTITNFMYHLPSPPQCLKLFQLSSLYLSFDLFQVKNIFIRIILFQSPLKVC